MEQKVPLSKRVEWFVCSLCDDGHLITSHCIDQPATLHDGFRAYEDKVHFVHNIGNGGVKHNSARNSSGR